MPRDPRDVHRTDQLLASMSEMALYIARYFAVLHEHGLTREEALALTVAYQQHVLAGVTGGGGTDGCI